MRAHPAIAVVTLILAGIGLKLTFLSAPMAIAGAGMGIDVSAMHQKIKNLPVEHFHDTTFVFSNGD